MGGHPTFDPATGEFRNRLLEGLIESPFDPGPGFENVACAYCWAPLVGHKRHSIIGVWRRRIATWLDRVRS